MTTTVVPELPMSVSIREALRHWHSDNSSDGLLTMFYQFRKLDRETGRSPRHTTNQLLLTTMAAMQQNHPQEVQLLRLRFLDQWPINHLANHLNIAESTVYTLQREAIARLTLTLQESEVLARAEQKQRSMQRLEAPTYVQLVGIETHIDHLIAQLRTPQPPWLVAIQGLGGIGKTALADALLRQLIEQGVYDEIGWVSARQNSLNLGGAIHVVAQPALATTTLVEALVRQLLPELAGTVLQQPEGLLPRLRTRLKQIPHLVVIDNLETLLDVESLLPLLQELANPSKFLLTARQGLYAAPNIHHFHIPELSEAHALYLIRQEARISNLPALATASDQDLHPIYATVGGNPLALRLVVGQTHIYPLTSILQHLQAARGQTAENLYTFIYWHAWHSLDAISQDVLLSMPLVNPYGDEVEVIAAVSDLEVEIVNKALNRLVTLNLVDARGGLNDRRYSIHGLTRTFLHEQVLRWRS